MTENQPFSDRKFAVDYQSARLVHCSAIRCPVVRRGNVHCNEQVVRVEFARWRRVQCSEWYKYWTEHLIVYCRDVAHQTHLYQLGFHREYKAGMLVLGLGLASLGLGTTSQEEPLSL